MNEKEIYELMNSVKSMILNHENREDVLNYINKINKEIVELPIFKEFRDLNILYETTYNDFLFANVGSDK